ncbi:MAG: hypothetical protein QNJ05_07865 [Woeseiaceae bacterium]|nr:hypothetical protein [Woeseiaceae bacterium]
MKRSIPPAPRLTGDTLKGASAAIAALLFAAARGARLLPGDLSDRFTGTIDLVEWAAAALGLLVVVIEKLDKRMETKP